MAFVPLGLARPTWIDYPSFDIADHVVRYESDGPVDRSELLRIAAELMGERLDHTRPLWRMDLVGPLEDGGSAIVWRIHHCMADGVTAVRLGGQILWDTERDPAPMEEREWRPEPEPSLLQLLASGLEDRVADAGQSISGLAAEAGARGAGWPPRAGR